MFIPAAAALSPLLAIAATGTALCLRGAHRAQAIAQGPSILHDGSVSAAIPQVDEKGRACLLVDTASAWGTTARMVCGQVMTDDGQQLCICPDAEKEPDRWVCG
jgi:hypothetical protein